MKRELLFEKRKKARSLRKRGWSIRKISRFLRAGTNSVTRWLEMDDNELEIDRRGWRAGKWRKYGPVTKKRIIEIAEESESIQGHFADIKKIAEEYQRRFKEKVSVWLLRRVIGDLKKTGLSVYPVAGARGEYLDISKLLRGLGRVVVKVDWGSARYGLKGKKTVKLLRCRYISPDRAVIINHVSGFTTNEAIRVLKKIWSGYVIPDIAALSRHSAFGGNLAPPSCIGDLAVFLLNLGIKPVFRVTKFMPDAHNVKSMGEWLKPQLFADFFPGQWERAKKWDMNMKLTNFQLEYRREGAQAVNRLVNKNPLYVKAFTQSELLNRRIKHFIEKEIFF